MLIKSVLRSLIESLYLDFGFAYATVLCNGFKNKIYID